MNAQLPNSVKGLAGLGADFRRGGDRAGLLALALAILLLGPRAVNAEEIHDAVRSNNIARADAILEQNGAEAANAVIGDGVTPLHLAAALNEDAMAGLLLAHGANVSARTSGGFTPLHWAGSRDSVKAAKTLIAAGADVNAKTLTGITPLHWAAGKNAVNVARLLIRSGANVEEESAAGLTPRHWASAHGASDVLTMLAYKIVSDEMATEVQPPEAEAGEAVMPPAAVTQAVASVALRGAPTATRLPDAGESEAPRATPMVRKPILGRRLTIDLGFNQAVEFVWLDRLKLWAGKYEVTNGQYRRFKPGYDSGSREGFSLNGDAQPVVNVSWRDTQKYIEWMNNNFAGSLPEGCRFRLPIEAEWVVMARCGDNREYPWGNAWPPPYGNFSDLTARRGLTDWRGIRGYDDGYAVSCAVGASGENEWGLFGMGGNAWEWCDDWFDASRKYKVRKGGSWDFDQQADLRVEARGFDRPEARYDTIGFRLVLSDRG